MRPLQCARSSSEHVAIFQYWTWLSRIRWRCSSQVERQLCSTRYVQSDISGDAFPDVTKSPDLVICCFAYTVNVCVKRQCIIYIARSRIRTHSDGWIECRRDQWHQEDPHQYRWMIASDLSEIQCEPPVNRLKAVRQRRESTLVLEWYMQLSVVGEKLFPIRRTASDRCRNWRWRVCDQWHVQWEQQGILSGSLRAPNSHVL